MEPSVIVGIVGILVVVITFYVGVKIGERRSRENRDIQLVSKAADEYVDMTRRNFDSGPHALAKIGLEFLGNDRLIRNAIHEMRVRSGTDPWNGQADQVANVDLVKFFEYVHEQKIRLDWENVAEIAKKVGEV